MVENPLKSARLLAKLGTMPHRMVTISRSPNSLSARMTGWNVVGAML